MILSCHAVKKSFQGKDVLKDISFHIEEREKAAIVGINGAGKSTLLKIIYGELPLEEGQVTIAKEKRLGYLAQHQNLEDTCSIYQELLKVREHLLQMEEQMRQIEHEMKQAKDDELEQMMEQYARLNQRFEQENGYAYQSEVTGVLKGLGFTESDFSKKISELSGGQKTRVALGRLLLSKPDVIMLDEPTNHLDLSSISWLESYLLNYPGAVLIVAHDRFFLDRIVTKVIEIENGVSQTFSGNYSAYAEKKKQLREAKLKAYFNQQQEIKHQEEVIAKLKQFNREKSIKRAESREKMLGKIDVLEKPQELNEKMRLTLTPRSVSGKDVLSVRGLKKSFPPVTLFKDLNFEISRGERLALIGKNGTGKTTILKIINNMIPADCGEVALGAKVQIGYYDQEQQVLHEEKTLFEELQDDYPTRSNTEIRNILAAFLFTGEDVFKRIKDLSGGERGRISLAKLMMSEANFLILDEPTNHLDIVSREILEQALCQYEGTVFYVSHDRYFINQTATRILELENQNLDVYLGNYEYYLQKKEEKQQKTEEQKLEAGKKITEGKLEWQKKKEEQAKIRKRESDLKRTEQEIDALERQIANIEEQLSLEEVYTDPGRLLALSEEKKEAEHRLEALLELWEMLA